jgi:hypothetical protein
MERLIVINSHSFVDVITNSSTELFVCDTDKSIEMVKEILQTVLDGYNMLNESEYDMSIFGQIYQFNYSEFKKWKEHTKAELAKFKESGDWSSHIPYPGEDPGFHTIEGWFTDREDEDDLDEKRKTVIEDGPVSGNYWSSNNNPYRNRLDLAMGENWDYSKKREEVEKIFQEIKESGDKPEWWNEPWKYVSFNRSTIDSLDGKIIIKGSDDNSIPYDIWNYINGKLNAKNYHLG